MPLWSCTWADTVPAQLEDAQGLWGDAPTEPAGAHEMPGWASAWALRISEEEDEALRMGAEWADEIREEAQVAEGAMWAAEIAATVPPADRVWERPNGEMIPRWAYAWAEEINSAPADAIAEVAVVAPPWRTAAGCQDVWSADPAASAVAPPPPPFPPQPPALVALNPGGLASGADALAPPPPPPPPPAAGLGAQGPRAAGQGVEGGEHYRVCQHWSLRPNPDGSIPGTKVEIETLAMSAGLLKHSSQLKCHVNPTTKEIHLVQVWTSDFKAVANFHLSGGSIYLDGPVPGNAEPFVRQFANPRLGHQPRRKRART